MRKRIVSPNTSRDKIKVLCSLMSKHLSDTELSILSELIDMSQNNNITLTVSLTKQIRDELKITTSSFNTSLHRLEQKKVLNKTGKTIMLSPVFNNLSELDGLIIEFKSQ